MGLFLQHKTDDWQWAVWKIEEAAEELLALLPDAWRELCKQEVQPFIAESRKMEWLAVRVLLYVVLNEDKEIDYSPEGKPFLTDHSFFISISHTKGYVAVMLSPKTDVGIDIEQYGNQVQRVAPRFIRPDEYTELYDGDIIWSMLLHWSAKETIFKRMEDADADFSKLRLTHFVPQKEGVFQVQEFATGLQGLYTVGYCIYPDLVLTWTLD